MIARWLAAAGLAALFAVSSSFAAEGRLAEVRYHGLGAVNARDLEGVLPFSVGDQWRDDFIAAAKSSLEQYYARRGFYHASVKARRSPSADRHEVLEIDVNEGTPCIVSQVTLADPPGFQSPHAMQRFKGRVESVVRLKAGDRYDEQLLTENLRELREWLVGENYILASTEDVRLEFNDATKTSVAVTISVNYGDRVSFGFQGNTVFTKGELDDFIAQVRSTGLGKDYVGVLQRRFVEEYRAKAYNNVKIEPTTGERAFEKHVTFHFKEGVRTELSEVRWDGLAEQNAEVAQQVFDNNASRLLLRGYYVEKDIDKVTALVIEDLKSRGFLSAKLVAKSVQSVKSPRNVPIVRVLIQIAEGEQTFVGKVRLAGFSYFSEENALATLKLAEGSPFNPFGLEEGLLRLRGNYIAEGFLDFKLVSTDGQIVQFSENNRLANIEVAVSEGRRVRIGDIHIRGLQKTREFVVAREITVQPGDWWLGPRVQETETNIRQLGLFSEVRVIPEPSPKGPDYRDMTILLTEAEPGSLEVGPGFRSDLGIRAFAKVGYNNILGRNWIGSLSAEGNRRINDQYRFIEYKFNATFVEPRFFDTRNLYTIGVSTQKVRFPPNFNASTTTFVTGFERKLTKAITSKLLYKLERIRQFDVIVDGQQFADDNQSMLIGSLVPSLVLDTRDSPFITTTGWLITTSLEYAEPAFSAQAHDDALAPAYQKWDGAIHRYIPLTKDIIWSNVLAGGFERSDIADRQIPLIKRFRLGGYGTIRGFPEDALNVDDQRLFGTLTYLNLRTQFDLPLVGELKIAPFLDAGNLYLDSFQKSPFLRAGAGLGFHYLTPIGPVNLDWGYKLNQVPGDTPYQFHFSVGFI